MLPVLGPDEVVRALPFNALVPALAAAFAQGAEAPVRHHHAIARPGEVEATLLIMPAWQPGAATGVKLVHVCPGNDRRGLPTVPGLYVLFDGPTGMPRAVLDGTALTLRRTAAASALAARHLARPDARRLVMVGAGALAPELIRAHASERPIETVRIWNRTPARAQALARRLAAEGLPCAAVADLDAALATTDIVSCATMSAEPLVRGAVVPPGCHVDLVGAYQPTMRESDGALLRRASLFVDTRAGALSEAGDILQAIDEGAVGADAILADLAELVTGAHPGRTRADEVTVFKSCGAALEDLAAARLVMERAQG